jgi:hypothetical protein
MPFSIHPSTPAITQQKDKKQFRITQKNESFSSLGTLVRTEMEIRLHLFNKGLRAFKNVYSVNLGPLLTFRFS